MPGIDGEKLEEFVTGVQKSKSMVDGETQKKDILEVEEKPAATFGAEVKKNSLVKEEVVVEVKVEEIPVVVPVPKPVVAVPKPVVVAYKEPTKEMVTKNLQDKLPDQPDFQHNGIVVLPFSLAEFKANVIDGTFSTLKSSNKFLKLDKQATNFDEIKWTTYGIHPDFYKGYNGKKTIRYRYQKCTIPVQGIPMVSEAHVTKHSMIYEDTSTTLRIKGITRVEGTPASPDMVQILEALDVCTMDARSK